jgi:trans-2,3-dihydro-3-hydroxyanthranilate isomerase
MRHRYHTLDVFTDRVFGGNPLAVFPDARGIAPARMQRAARELNLSETVFVLPPETAEGTRRLRIFTPGVELPFAGHPTVGTAILLALLGEVPLEGGEARVVFEEGAGPVPVTIRARDGEPAFARLSAAMLPERRPSPVARGELAAMLGLSGDDVVEDGGAAEAVSCGVPFLIVPVRSVETLGRIHVDAGAWNRLLAREWAPHLYAFAPAAGGGADFRVRMFAPAMGIAEDPATGAAASSFAGYLAMREAAEDGAFRWTVEQGIEMGRPSTLHLEADKAAGRVTAVRVGGSAVPVGEGWMEIPEE